MVNIHHPLYWVMGALYAFHMTKMGFEMSSFMDIGTYVFGVVLWPMAAMVEWALPMLPERTLRSLAK